MSIEQTLTGPPLRRTSPRVATGVGTLAAFSADTEVTCDGDGWHWGGNDESVAP
jgi:hypothetical protein